jgi:C1A family cysteine protease
MIQQNSNAFMNELVKGPVAIGVDASPLQMYSGGVITFDDCGDKLDHGVQAVGYTDKVWIIRNSWGDQWGEAGFFYLEKGVTNKNTCGLMNNAVVPILGGENPTPPAPTPTKQFSCQNNCGKEADDYSCSCQSDCETYSECCDDYQKYCPKPSPTPTPTPSTGSCVNNCGQ